MHVRFEFLCKHTKGYSVTVGFSLPCNSHYDDLEEEAMEIVNSMGLGTKIVSIKAHQYNENGFLVAILK